MTQAAAGDNVRSARAPGPGELEVVVSSGTGGPEVRLVGELDLSTAEVVREELARLAADAPVVVTVDLADLRFIDSTGLSVLVTGLKRFREQGGDMALRSPTPGTRKVLEITGLIQVFSIS